MAASPTNSARLSRDELLESLLRWEGRLRRNRVQKLLGVGPIRASQLIAEFAETHPGWMGWNAHERSHLATSSLYGRTSATTRSADADSLARYLVFAGVPTLDAGSSSDHVVWAAFRDLTVPRAQVFARLHEAAGLRRCVAVSYRSMRNPEPHPLTIEPHSLVRAGRRWHTRAFVQEYGEFRDLVIGRLMNVRVLEAPAKHGANDDVAWNTAVPVRLEPHPALNPAQQSLIQHELLGDVAARVETCRGPLVHYFIQDQRAAIDLANQLPPEYQLAVTNTKDLAPWLLSQ